MTNTEIDDFLNDLFNEEPQESPQQSSQPSEGVAQFPCAITPEPQQLHSFEESPASLSGNELPDSSIIATTITDTDFDQIIADNLDSDPNTLTEVTDYIQSYQDDEDADADDYDIDQEESNESQSEAEVEPPVPSSSLEGETPSFSPSDPSDSLDSSDQSDLSAPSDPSAQSPEPDSLPLNSPTFLMDEANTRFSGAEWFNEIQKARIILAGIGGIGSNVAFQLARLHPANITLYDDDTVERVNMAGQLFSTADIGRNKASAILSMIELYTNATNIYAIQQRFERSSTPGDIMICGFDNMRARSLFFDRWLQHVNNKPMEQRHHCLFIDGRLSMDTLQVLCIQGNDTYNIHRYLNEFLFSDSEADETICSMKQTTYLACMIASIMVNLFTNFIANQLNPIIPYDLPFFTEYDAQNVLFKTES